MKLFLGILALTSSLFFFVACSDEPQDLFRKYQNRLQLKDNQVQQARPIILAQEEKLSSLMEKMKGEQSQYSQYSDQVRGIQQDTDLKLAPILNQAQLDEFHAIVSEEMKQYLHSDEPKADHSSSRGYNGATTHATNHR